MGQAVLGVMLDGKVHTGVILDGIADSVQTTITAAGGIAAEAVHADGDVGQDAIALNVVSFRNIQRSGAV